MKKLLYIVLLLSVFSGWYSYNYDFVDSPLYIEWTKDYENNYDWRYEERVLHPLKPMHDPEPIEVYAEVPMDYAMAPETSAPAPVEKPVEMPAVIVTAVPVEKDIWDNPLINSLVIPLGLYFGKKLIDLMFSKVEKKAIA